jgi:hypothetical protein
MSNVAVGYSLYMNRRTESRLGDEEVEVVL